MANADADPDGGETPLSASSSARQSGRLVGLKQAMESEGIRAPPALARAVSRQLAASSNGGSPDGGSSNVEDSVASFEVNERERLFGGRMPTDNAFEGYALMHCKHAFEERTIQLLSALQVSSAVDNCFVTAKSLKRATAYRALKGDVIVAGPPRCGQSGILAVLDVLRHGAAREMMTSEIASTAIWIEGAHVKDPTQGSEGRRLLKTNLTLRSVLGEIKSVHARAGEFKVVCVLRDPLDARWSHYKLVKRVFKAFVPRVEWEYDLDDFVNVPLAASDAVKPLSHTMSDAAKSDYETYLVEVMRAVEQRSPNLLVVFYEDFCHSPAEVIARIAEFTGWSKGNKEVQALALSRAVYQDPGHPLCSSAPGQRTQAAQGPFGGRGAKEFSRQARMLYKDKWDFVVRARYPKLTSYEKYYEFLTEKKWAFGDRQLDNKPLKKTNSLARFLRWIFKGAVKDVDHDAFAKAQHGAIKPRKSVSSKQFLELQQQDDGGYGERMPMKSTLSVRSDASGLGGVTTHNSSKQSLVNRYLDEDDM
jgi:hypothetical protein